MPNANKQTTLVTRFNSLMQRKNIANAIEALGLETEWIADTETGEFLDETDLKTNKTKQNEKQNKTK